MTEDVLARLIGEWKRAKERTAPDVLGFLAGVGIQYV
jgi:hypothetical protein